MRELRLDHLRTLMEVAERGSFSAAARALNLSQPAVSLQVRELESRLGLPLLERIGKSAHPTAAGRALIEQAHRIFDITDRTVSLMREHKRGLRGRVHIGTGTTALTYLLPRVLQQLRRRFPDAEWLVTTGNTDEIVRLMNENIIDLGLVTLPVDAREFVIAKLGDFPMTAVLPPHARPPKRAITARELAAFPLISGTAGANYAQIIEAWLRRGGVDTRPAMRFDNIEAVNSAVTSGLGASIVPGETLDWISAKHRLVVRPLDPPLARTLAVIHRRNRTLDEPARAAAEAMLALAKKRR